MVFELDKATPQIPLAITFETPASVHNIKIHHCIIDEWASTCIMFESILQKLGFPELKPYEIMLGAYDGHRSTPVNLYPNIPVKLAGKTVLMDTEVLDTQLDYNILLSQSYMYEMLVVASSVFRIMMFAHEVKVITIDPLTYYEKITSPTLDGVLPLVSQEVVTTYTKLSLGQFKPSSLLGKFPGDPPIIQEIVPSTGALVWMMTSSNTTQTPE